MALRTLGITTLVAGFAIGAATVVSAQNAPGPGASGYAPGHSTTNVPPGQGGVKGTTWNPPGQMMKQDRAGNPKASGKRNSGKNKSKG